MTRLFVLAAAIVLGAAPAAFADHTASALAGGGAGPINTMTADTLPEGLWSVCWQVEQLDLTTFSNAELTAFAEQGVDAHSVDPIIVQSVCFEYGVSDRFTLGARLPYVARHDVREPEDEGGVPGVAAIGDSDGLGDLSVYGKYRLGDPHDHDGLEWALLGGVKLATGESHERDDEGALFETEFQPGSGSVDPLLGLAVTRRFGSSSLSASMLGVFTTEGTQDTELGDIRTYNLGYAYRLGGEAPHEHDHAGAEAGHDNEHAHAHAEAGTAWDLILELNAVHRQAETIDGAKDPNSGGTRVFLSPGVRATVDEHWSAYASVGYPISEDLNGAEQETDLRAVVGVSWSF